jgi:MoaA/NifB/PqqE/SkfB family radical SAM enzyme
MGDKAIDPVIKSKSLPDTLVIDLINDLSDLGVRDIYFTGGGEPFMHPRILDFMRHIKQKGIHLDMSTNFTLVDEKIAEQLVDIGIDHMNLSLWAGSGETYAKQHPNKDLETFKKMGAIIDHIVAFKKAKGVTLPALGMYNVINTYNYHEVDQMLEFAFRHRMDDIQFTPVDTMPERTDCLALTPEHLNELIVKFKKMPELKRTLEQKYSHGLEIINYETFLRRIDNKDAQMGNYDASILDDLPSCYAGWSFARVLANGDVNSCLKSFKIPVGNIHESGFKDIWFGEKQNQFRSHTLDYDKDDPYLKNIGNDRFTDGQGCHKCCDNVGLNIFIHQELSELTPGTKQMLKLFRLFHRNSG